MGGGERYTFALAEVLLDHGFDVEVAGPGLVSCEERGARGFPVHVPVRALDVADVPEATRDVDLFVQVTTVPPVRSFARRSVGVVQFPTPWFGDLKTRVRALDYRLLVYSDYVRRRWRRRATVLTPPVELGTFEPERKEQLIVTVGRIFPEFHRKRHDALIDAFAELSGSADGWRFVIAGGVDWSSPGAEAFVGRLREQSAGLPIDIRENVSHDELRSLYARASLYWHGAGYGRAQDEPDQVEHFGISVVEAMSYGAVPLVADDGGPRQIVQDDWGARWRSLQELCAESQALISSPDVLAAKAAEATARSNRYSADVFAERARRLLGLR